MEITHLYDSEERQHYLFRHQYSLKIKPRLLYAGKLDKKFGWREKAHNHDFCEIMYVADGCGSVVVGGRRFHVRQGEGFFLDGGGAGYQRLHGGIQRGGEFLQFLLGYVVFSRFDLGDGGAGGIAHGIRQILLGHTQFVSPFFDVGADGHSVTSLILVVLYIINQHLVIFKTKMGNKSLNK